MLGRLLRSADFERVLALPACARSAHFAVHYLQGRPGRGARKPDLSTGDEQGSSQPVDDSAPATRSEARPSEPSVWLGAVVPKRHARRAVTRTLLKRQIRAALLRRGAPGQPPLQTGLWVVRLRAPFDRALFVSAASDALRGAARGELDVALDLAERRLSAQSAAGQP